MLRAMRLRRMHFDFGTHYQRLMRGVTLQTGFPLGLRGPWSESHGDSLHAAAGWRLGLTPGRCRRVVDGLIDCLKAVLGRTFSGHGLAGGAGYGI